MVNMFPCDRVEVVSNPSRFFEDSLGYTCRCGASDYQRVLNVLLDLSMYLGTLWLAEIIRFPSRYSLLIVAPKDTAWQWLGKQANIRLPLQ